MAEDSQGMTLLISSLICDPPIYAQIVPSKTGQISMRKRWGVRPSPPRTTPKIGRNEPCPCGCGKKLKKCSSKKGIM